MELTCALVLLIVGSVAASPYGYGVKGGAAAKADARAVAGSSAVAGGIPLSIPSGASYTGSFSQSSSSSSSSASSSSSSSSFSYSGSGANGGVHSGPGCGSGSCNTSGVTGVQGSAAAGSQVYSGAKAGSLAGGYVDKTPAGSYGHKYESGDSHANNAQDCGSGDCRGANANTLNGNSAGYGSQSGSASDAKAAASAGAGSEASSVCSGSDCKHVPDSVKCVAGKCDPKDKCSSGTCGATSQSQDSNLCASGNCGSNQEVGGSSSLDNENNDINVNGNGNSAPGSGCVNGNCGPTPTVGSSASGYSKPALDLTVPKLEPPCSGSSCNLAPTAYGSSSQTKAPYLSTSYQNGNQFSSAGYGGSSKPTYNHGSSSSYSLNYPTEADCAPGTPGCSLSLPNSGSKGCATGTCGSNPSAPGYNKPPNGQPGYSHGNLPSITPSNPGCAPGSPGCSPPPMTGFPSDPGCTSGNCDPHSSVPAFGMKPSYSHGSSPSHSPINPNVPACTPGTPGCDTSPLPIGPSGCASGNCGVSPTAYGIHTVSKPSYPSSYSPNPSGPGCLPGSPGCSAPISPGSPSVCASGNCGGPTTGGYDASPSYKPTYSHASPPALPLTPSGAVCAPGTPGCGTGLFASGSAPGYHSNFNKPGYQGSSLNKPFEQACSPGSPGCGPSPSGPSDCKSGNCGGSSSLPGYGSSLGFNTPNTQTNVPSYSTAACSPGTPGCGLPSNSGPAGLGSKPGYSLSPPKPISQACAPGTPGCLLPLGSSGQSGCASGYCDEFPPIGGQGVPNVKPYSQGSLPSFIPLKPSEPGCAPGTPGCAITPPLNPSVCASGSCGSLPPPLGCAPGTLGCSGIPSGPSSHTSVGSSAPGYGAASIGSSIHQAGYGGHSSGSYHNPSTTNPAHSAASGDATAGAGGQHDTKDKPVYVGGFGGPAGLLKPNDYDTPALSYLNKPSTPASGTTPVKPNCASGICDTQPSSNTHSRSDVPSDKPYYSQGSLPSFIPLKPSDPGCAPGTPGCAITPPLNPSGCASGNCGSLPPPLGCAPGTPGCSVIPSGQLSHTSVGSSAPGYGAASIGSSIHQAGYGSHGSGSYHNPSTTIPAHSAASGDATAGTGGQHDTKDKPVYTGGFGGPAGLLKPNEYDTPASSNSNKPSKPASGTNPVKPNCASGICDTQPSSNTHSGAVAGAHATAGASASANAVAYTGGFGGPPGFLKPYDDGKIDLKSLPGKQQADSAQNLSPSAGSGIHSSYSNGGSQANAVAHANAASIGSAGAGSGHNQVDSSGYGGYSHGHDGGSGCGGGCGSSGSGSLSYGGSLALSKAGALDASSAGQAAAGAAAKSVASATSGARAFGSSYASSSASAHAGASVKGGYGRR